MDDSSIVIEPVKRAISTSYSGFYKRKEKDLNTIEDYFRPSKELENKFKSMPKIEN